MDDKNYFDWEKDVSKVVKDVMDSIDIADIKKNIKSTLSDVEVAFRKQMDNQGSRGGRQAPNSKGHYSRYYDRLRNRAESGRPAVDPRVYDQTPRVKQAVMAPKLPGRVGSILNIVFGSIGIGIFLPTGLGFLLGGIFGGGSVFFGLAGYLCLPFLAGSISLLASGISVSRRNRRCRQYLKIIGERSYCKIKELALYTNQSVSYTLKDIKKMIKKKLFPEGHLDAEQEHFILDHKTYELYLESKAGSQQRLEAEKSREAAGDDNPQLSSETESVVKKGRDYIDQMKSVSAQIPGEGISGKLKRLEAVTTKIFIFVEKNPNKLPEIRKFLDYYLPTTLKLIYAYKEFDGHSFEGSNITTAKEEITDTLDTINLAFENLFDGLFEEAAMDISTDIAVLEAMLAQEGLTGNDFQNGSKHKE